jgi:hypothetical protein
MAKRKRKTQKKQEKVEQKRSVMRKEPQTLFDRHAWEQGTPSIGETPFLPRMEEHAELIERAASDEHRANLVLQLQQTYGNRYVQRLIESRVVQAKLNVSAPNDIYEQEADRVAKAATEVQRQPEEEEEMLQGKASQVQRQPEEEEEMLQGKASQVQRQPEEDEEMLQGKASQVQRQPEEEEMLQGKAFQVQRQAEEEEEEEEPIQAKVAPEVQRQPEEEEMLQGRAAVSRPATVPENLETRIKTAQGSGHPLSDNTREPMEQSFGADFSGVRVHTDSEADALNKQLNAKAFTTGRDVFFRENEYSPGSDSGRELIAHELTHVVQQTGSENQRGQVVQRFLSDDEIGTLGITKEQYGRLKRGDKWMIARMLKVGNLTGAQNAAQEAVKVTSRVPPPLPTRPSPLQPPRRLGRPTKPLQKPTRPAPKPPTTVTKLTEEETIPAKQPAKAPPPEAYNALVQQATYISASGGGMGGVFFLHSKKGEGPELVVKFEPGEVVRGKFAETLLAKAGLQTTRSLAFRAGSRQGKKIKSKVQALATDDKCHTTDPAKLLRFNQVVANTLNQGQVILVSDYVEALGASVAEILAPSSGIAPERRKWREEVGAMGKLVEAFNDIENAVDLGKILVLDAFLGNQDRLDAMNFANIMLAMRGGKWRFVLIDNEADVPSMKGELEVRLKELAETNMQLGTSARVTNKVPVASWVDKLIEGGPALEKAETARINFLTDTQKAAGETINSLKLRYFIGTDGKPFKETESAFKAIKWGQLQRGALHGIHQGANSILNTNLKNLKKLYSQETKALSKSEFLSLFGMQLKWQYVQMVMEQKMKHDAAKAVLVQMASKKLKELTGSADYVWPAEKGHPERESKIKAR